MSSWDMHKCSKCGKSKQWLLMADTCGQNGSCKKTADEVCMVCDSATEEERQENLTIAERLER